MPNERPRLAAPLAGRVRAITSRKNAPHARDPKRSERRGDPQAVGGGRRNWKGEIGSDWTPSVWSASSGASVAGATFTCRACTGAALGTTCRNVRDRRLTNRPARVGLAEVLPTSTGAAAAARSAHSAVVTTITARTCRVRRIGFKSANGSAPGTSPSRAGIVRCLPPPSRGDRNDRYLRALLIRSARRASFVHKSLPPPPSSARIAADVESARLRLPPGGTH
jgi:hypothetical protein